MFLEINGANYSAENITADVYNVSVDLTSSGAYNYYWGAWGNGTNHNYNTSTLQSFTVNSTTIIQISQCQELNQSNITYQLTANVNSSGYMF